MCRHLTFNTAIPVDDVECENLQLNVATCRCKYHNWEICTCTHSLSLFSFCLLWLCAVNAMAIVIMITLACFIFLVAVCCVCCCCCYFCAKRRHKYVYTSHVRVHTLENACESILKTQHSHVCSWTCKRYWFSPYVSCVSILNLTDREWLKRSATWTKRRAFVSEVPTGEPRERQRATKSKGNMVSFTIHLFLPHSITSIPTGYGMNLDIFASVNNCYLFFLYWLDLRS